jgi:hypothetical protein
LLRASRSWIVIVLVIINSTSLPQKEETESKRERMEIREAR